MIVVLAILVALGGPQAARAGGPFDPLAEQAKAVKDALPKPDDDAARLEPKGRERAGPPARVVLLPIPGGSLGDDPSVRTRIETLIGRAGATFVGDVDLAQQGRVRERVVGRVDEYFAPRAQPGRVLDDQLDYVRAEVEDARERLRAIERSRRGDRSDVAADLLDVVEQDPIWFNDRPATRRALFELVVTLGWAAMGLPDQVSPYYKPIERRSDNFFLYQAAAMIWEDRQVGADDLAKLVPAPARREVERILAMIDRGEHPPIELSFHSDLIDAEALRTTYRIVINGVERVPELVNGELIVAVPRGRVDVSLDRKDGGYGLSHRIDFSGLRGERPRILDLARSESSVVRRELEVHVQECERDLETPGAMAVLAVYAALHPDEDVYVATIGRTLRDVDVWAWDRDTYELHKLLDVSRGFAFRFALLGTAGASFGGGSLRPRDVRPDAGDTTLSVPDPTDVLSFSSTSVPIDVQLRGQWHRLVLGFGVQASSRVGGEPPTRWSDRWDLPYERSASRDPSQPLRVVDPTTGREALHTEPWNRLIYGLVGVVLLEHAPLGLGPRAYLRFGGSNLPHALDLTGHVGATYDPSFGKRPPTGRFAALIDVDAYAGVRIPYAPTLYDLDPDPEHLKPRVVPNLGFSVGAGWSF